METTLLAAPLAAAPPAVPAYPTLRESWGMVGWYLLAGLVVGGSCYKLLLHTTRLPKAELMMISTIIINVALLLFLRSVG